jgi:hypothetical protein
LMKMSVTGLIGVIGGSIGGSKWNDNTTQLWLRY